MTEKHRALVNKCIRGYRHFVLVLFFCSCAYTVFLVAGDGTREEVAENRNGAILCALVWFALPQCLLKEKDSDKENE